VIIGVDANGKDMENGVIGKNQNHVHRIVMTKEPYPNNHAISSLGTNIRILLCRAVVVGAYRFRKLGFLGKGFFFYCLFLPWECSRKM